MDTANLDRLKHAAILSRIKFLEQRVEELSRPALWFEPTHTDLEPWLMDLQRAQAFVQSNTSATIEISGAIDQAMSERVQRQIERHFADRHLDIVIDSTGGDYFPSMAIYKAIRWAPAMTKHVHMGRHCSSGALLAAMAGDWRIARPDTKIVLHLVGDYPSADLRWTANDHVQAARRQSILDRQMLSLIVERTGADFDDLHREASHEMPSTLEWCLTRGLVDEVRT